MIVKLIAEITTKFGLNWLSHVPNHSFITSNKKRRIMFISSFKLPKAIRKRACHGRDILFIFQILTKDSFRIKKT